MEIDNKLVKIAVFYDGNYFSHVSNYYNYEHQRKARLSISGLHEFIRNYVAQSENLDSRLCQIIDAHYFRGRLSSFDANEANKLYAERIFDDILMNEGVVTHYAPLRIREDGRREEKGIDVWLALEAFELALYKKFSVFVLIACDGDYVHLVRKLNTLGIRVMVLGWDFEYTDERTGKLRQTTTSLDLLKEVTYPVSMHETIDNKIKKNDALINNLFVNKEKFPPISFEFNSNSNNTSNSNSGNYNTAPNYNSTANLAANNFGKRKRSSILSLKNGYGFIFLPPNNLYFHWTSLVGSDFSELQEEDKVEFTIGKNERGEDVAIDVMRVE